MYNCTNTGKKRRELLSCIKKKEEEEEKNMQRAKQSHISLGEFDF